MALRVVIIEDNEDLLEVLTHLIKSRGHEVLGYAEPTICPLYNNESCNCERKEACGDVILTDNCMPKMTGLEFIQRQALRGCQGIMRNKAVMSGMWTSEDIEVAKNLGCKIFEKPADLMEILNWLDECEKALARNQ